MASGPLTCWKDIACYLGKGVRTVQRWERECGLPVRRPTGGGRQIICTSREELDLWLANWSRRQDRVQTGARAQAALDASRQLRTEQRNLRADLARSMERLLSQCQQLALHSASFSKPDRTAQPEGQRREGPTCSMPLT